MITNMTMITIIMTMITAMITITDHKHGSKE